MTHFLGPNEKCPFFKNNSNWPFADDMIMWSYKFTLHILFFFTLLLLQCHFRVPCFFFFFWHRPQLLLLDESFYSVCVTQWDWVPRVRLWEKEGGESDLQERRKRKSDKKPIPRAKSSFFGNIIRTCRQQNVKNLIFEKWRNTNLIFLPNFFGHPPRKPNIHSLYSLNPKKKHLEIKPGRHSTIVKALMP